VLWDIYGQKKLDDLFLFALNTLGECIAQGQSPFHVFLQGVFAQQCAPQFRAAF
jgi:hypothetical protein